MPRPVRTVRPVDIELLLDALNALKLARTSVRIAHAPRTLRTIERAIKSTDGALRHAQRVWNSRENDQCQ